MSKYTGELKNLVDELNRAGIEHAVAYEHIAYAVILGQDEVIFKFSMDDELLGVHIGDEKYLVKRLPPPTYAENPFGVL